MTSRDARDADPLTDVPLFPTPNPRTRKEPPMALSPRDTAAQRGTARRRVEDLVDDAIRADDSLDRSGEPAAPQVVFCRVPPGSVGKAEWDVRLRPLYLAQGWASAEWVAGDDGDFVELRSGPAE